MEDETLVRKPLNVVPDRYLQIVASIEQYSDLSEMTLEEAIGRLKTYEERIKYKKGKQVDNQEKLMSRDMRIKERHIAPNCPQRTKPNEQSNLVKGDLEPTLLMEILEDSNEEKHVKEVEEQKEYMSEHINDEPEWTDFKAGNLEVTNKHHDQGIKPIEEDNEFPNNDDDDYASPTRDSPTHSQAPHTPSTRLSQVNSQVTPNISTQSNYQTKDEPKNYKEASKDQKWIEAMIVESDSINRNNTWELTTLPKGHKAIGLKWVFKTKKDANGNLIKHKARLVVKGYIQEHGIDFGEVFAAVARMETI
nr:ribonuclease H-like domain, reverse transcriptase, RNA-dependent DNA polymerase [Tanacetum cinerariifolium]GEW44868.1 ribonuclease H-like domain, reverse transcriptase, RNA-dependent DNA polymerase [Tanacetum cinerariifolium]